MRSRSSSPIPPKLAAAALVAVVMTAATILPASAQTQSQPPRNPQDSRLEGELREATGGAGRLSRHAGTGRIRFFGTTPDRPVRRTTLGVPAGASPEVTARKFLETYGPLFGIDQAGELGPGRTTTRDRGRATVRFQQTHKGVPVLAGELNVDLDQARNVLAVGGEARPGLNLDVSPGIGAGGARRQAVAAISKQRNVAAGELQTTDPTLWIYDPALLGGAVNGPPATVWRVEVTSTGAEHMRELVLIQAQSGNVLLHFDQEAEAKNRLVCDRNNTRTAGHTCSGPYARTEGGPATGTTDVDLAYDYAGASYDYFKDNFGRDSLDGAGMPLVSTVRYCSTSGACPYPNAFWDGSQMTYGQGFAAADDVVGHELTHGVTEFTAGLFYYYQSGAINESLSDVFGELIDLTDGRGNDSAGVRWQIGEDLAGGGFRNMANPSTYSDPDSMASVNYYSGAADQGGVHSNSGVNNKAASLMVDGGSLNGVTVSALGINKVGHLYYEALTGLMTSASDYQDLYDILPQACFSLVGTNGITSADCDQVRNAVEATRMNRQPTTGAATVEAPLCSAGETPTDLFFDNLENPASGNWVKTTASGYGWAYPQNPNAYSNFDATYATSGKTNMFGDDPDSPASYSIARSAGVVPPSGGNTYLRFNHAYGFEQFYDGGVVEYSTDSGGTWADAGPLFVDGGYNTQLYSGTDHPLAGRRAFSAESFGYGSSRINLSSLAGRSVRFRFTIGADTNQGGYGWYVDDVRVYNCKTIQPTALAVNDVSVVEGNSGPAPATFTITRSGDTSGTSTVKYATATTGTATSGSDYTAVPLTTVSFGPGETTKAATVNVTGDLVAEANEYFYLVLSAPTGASVSDSTGLGWIMNDD